MARYKAKGMATIRGIMKSILYVQGGVGPGMFS